MQMMRMMRIATNITNKILNLRWFCLRVNPAPRGFEVFKELLLSCVLVERLNSLSRSKNFLDCHARRHS